MVPLKSLRTHHACTHTLSPSYFIPYLSLLLLLNYSLFLSLSLSFAHPLSLSLSLSLSLLSASYFLFTAASLSGIRFAVIAS